jgi:hypothetical protein
LFPARPLRVPSEPHPGTRPLGYRPSFSRTLRLHSSGLHRREEEEEEESHPLWPESLGVLWSGCCGQGKEPQKGSALDDVLGRGRSRGCSRGCSRGGSCGRSRGGCWCRDGLLNSCLDGLLNGHATRCPSVGGGFLSVATHASDGDPDEESEEDSDKHPYCEHCQ